MAFFVGKAPIELEDIKALEESTVLRRFTAEDAWTLGEMLRTRLRTQSSACVINITLASGQVLFHAVTHSGAAPDNDIWVARKRSTVMRWGVSSWYMNNKFNSGNEEAFRSKYMLGEKAGDYAIHGGGVPLRVEGVEGIVAVVIVSGLKQQEDHMVVIEGLKKLKESSPI
ncbi:MAG: hypothetical protein M1828_003162 [Chrysothrix sp. TS-e1954]|nr:MAG: hypothetical protein M1828_003162 [Chrysothrix sp. TS-e1954]